MLVSYNLKKNIRERQIYNEPDSSCYYIDFHHSSRNIKYSADQYGLQQTHLFNLIFQDKIVKYYEYFNRSTEIETCFIRQITH